MEINNEKNYNKSITNQLNKQKQVEKKNNHKERFKCILHLSRAASFDRRSPTSSPHRLLTITFSHPKHHHPSVFHPFNWIAKLGFPIFFFIPNIVNRLQKRKLEEDQEVFDSVSDHQIFYSVKIWRDIEACWF